MKAFKRLLFGIIVIAICATWFIWFGPYWVMTGKDPIEVFSSDWLNNLLL